MQYHFWPQECCNAILYQAASPNLSSQTMCLILLHSTTGASSVNQKSITDLVSHVIIKNVPRSLSTSVCCKHLCTSLFSTKRITIPVFKSVCGGGGSFSKHFITQYNKNSPVLPSNAWRYNNGMEKEPIGRDEMESYFSKAGINMKFLQPLGRSFSFTFLYAVISENRN